MWLKVPGEERSTMKSCLLMSRREAEAETEVQADTEVEVDGDREICTGTDAGYCRGVSFMAWPCA